MRAPALLEGRLPHINSCKYSGLRPTISGCFKRPEAMNPSIASLVGNKISAWGSNGFASRQCFSVSRPFRFATSISRSHAAFNAAAYQRECLNLVDGSLGEISERSRPIDSVTRAEFVTDVDGIANAERGVLAHLRGFRRGACGKHSMVKSLGRDHRALDAMLFETGFDACDDVVLFAGAEVRGWNHVAVVRAPMGDADFSKLANHIRKRDGLSSRRVKQSLSLICSGPLRPADEVLSANIRCVTPAAHTGETLDERPLLIRMYRLHAE